MPRPALLAQQAREGAAATAARGPWVCDPLFLWLLVTARARAPNPSLPCPDACCWRLPAVPTLRRRRDDAKRRVVELAPAVGKWLKACGASDAAVGGITWQKVQQRNKKVCGQIAGQGARR
mgnify:CR=1 FL=1